MEYLLEAKGISKSFGGVKALDDVALNLKSGEVHCLVGENGAGKSTFGKIIAGFHEPDEGSLVFLGSTYKHFTPAKAKELRIAMVTQELNLMPHLSIAENIYMFEKESYIRDAFLNRKLINQKADRLFEQFHLSNMPPVTTLVGNLTIAHRQIVEIMRAISQQNSLLIFDEPTTTLSISEVEQLFNLIRGLKKEGVSILLVTHRFKEIFEIGDVVTILCDGKIVKERIPVKETNEFDLVKMMVGRDIKDFYGTKEKLEIGPVVFEVIGLSDGISLKDISFSVHQREIVGFAGLVGAGRTEIMETIFGHRKMTSGEILLNGKSLKNMSIKDRIKSGIVFLPEDRKNKGLALNLSIDSNMDQVDMCLKEKFVVYEGQYREHNKKLLQRLNIKHKSTSQKIADLSGGNQQKVLLSKWLSQESSVFIVDEPTRGIDVGTKIEVYELIKSLAREGKAIIMVSSEMQELIAICDRILVVNEGRIVSEFSQEEATEQKILKQAIPVQ